jgi:hypothetical protein
MMFWSKEKDNPPPYEKDAPSSREDARLQEDQVGWMPISQEKVQQMRAKDQVCLQPNTLLTVVRDSRTID